MKYTAEIDVMPLKEILDPQGKAVLLGLHNLGFNGVAQVRIGKHITLELDAPSETEAHRLAEKACQQLLANQIMEGFTITVSEK